MLTIAYVRVSTDDQVEHSPEAKRRRCLEHTRTANLGAPRVLSDEGWSAKNLYRPAMAELTKLVEADQVAHVIVWRLDRLSRDAGDLNRLIRLFDEHCVTLHSLNEGLVEVGTASGRMQAGIHGVFAPYYREHNIENIKLGQREAVRKGLWINRAPTGYTLDDRILVANDDAHLVRRAFTLRAAGKSYPAISAACGLPYSTVRSILHNRVYLGLTRLGDQWFPGAHEPIVSQAEFDAAHRGHVPGRRRAPICCRAVSGVGRVVGSCRSTPTAVTSRSTAAAIVGRAATACRADPPVGCIVRHVSASTCSALMTSCSRRSAPISP